MFADDVKIFRIIRSPDDYIALQKDLDALYVWSSTWQLQFNILKCKFLHLGSCHDFGSYFLNGTQIDQASLHKDLGILFDDSLKFHDHASTVSGKANCVLGLISKSFEF